jgi:hypothetical protein
MSGLLSTADINDRERQVRFVPTCDIKRARRPKEKAARRRLLNSTLMIVDHDAINAVFDFRR